MKIQRNIERFPEDQWVKTPPIDANAVVNRDGSLVVNRDGQVIIADPTPRTS